MSDVSGAFDIYTARYYITACDLLSDAYLHAGKCGKKFKFPLGQHLSATAAEFFDHILLLSYLNQPADFLKMSLLLHRLFAHYRMLKQFNQLSKESYINALARIDSLREFLDIYQTMGKAAACEAGLSARA